MGVVIREFEVNVEPSEQPTGQSQSANTNAAQKLSAQDISSMLSREQQRSARVWAH